MHIQTAPPPTVLFHLGAWVVVLFAFDFVACEFSMVHYGCTVVWKRVQALGWDDAAAFGLRGDWFGALGGDA
eukprot:10559784-Alexandrium_andersonii.AAC.1